MIKLLKDVFQDDKFCCGDPLYNLEEIKEKFTKVIMIGDNCLALNLDNPFDDDKPELSNGNISFILFNLAVRDDDETRMSIVFTGNGPTGALREMRHIYWGPKQEGYTFYLDRKLVINSFKILDEYFD